jgi:hypothetical protein
MTRPAQKRRSSPKALWSTPAWVTQALLRVDPPTTHVVLEPSAGEGAIVAELLDRWFEVCAIEVRAARPANPALERCTWHVGDVLTMDLPRQQQPFSIVANPPWDPPEIMLAHVSHYLGLGARYVACLLPLRFFDADARCELLKQYPVTNLYLLRPRPRFGGPHGGGTDPVAWWVWKRKDGRRWKTQRVTILEGHA